MATSEAKEIKKQETLVRFSIISYKTRLRVLCSITYCSVWSQLTFYFIFQVSWLRHDDTHLLTIGRLTYTSDMRFKAIHKLYSEDYLLQIKPTTHRDSGKYACQISTTPPNSHIVTLTIAGLPYWQFQQNIHILNSDWLARIFRTLEFILQTKTRKYWFVYLGKTFPQL